MRISTTQNMNEVFIDDDSDDETSVSRQEWSKLHSARVKEGYREGVSLGHESQLQTAFNTGYVSSVSATHTLARLRGLLTAVIGHHLVAPGHSKLSSEQQERGEHLIEQLSLAEKSLLSHTSHDTGECSGHSETTKSKSECSSEQGRKLDDVDCCGSNEQCCGTKQENGDEKDTKCGKSEQCKEDPHGEIDGRNPTCGLHDELTRQASTDELLRQCKELLSQVGMDSLIK